MRLGWVKEPHDQGLNLGLTKKNISVSISLDCSNSSLNPKLGCDDEACSGNYAGHWNSKIFTALLVLIFQNQIRSIVQITLSIDFDYIQIWRFDSIHPYNFRMNPELIPHEIPQ